MNAQIIQQFLQLILTFITRMGVKSSSDVGMILSDLIAAIPIIVELAPKEINAVKNIISLLRSSGKATQAQIDALNALDKEADSGFDTSVAVYLRNHPTVTNQVINTGTSANANPTK